MISAAEFQQRLAETIAWCRDRISTQDLWTPELQPPLERYSRSLTDRLPQFPDEAAVEFVVMARRQKVGKVSPIGGPNQISTHAQQTQQGRFLLYKPEDDLQDGAAEVYTRGFIRAPLDDGSNVPPWDTWVAWVQPCIVCWISPKLIDLAQDGIDANPEECIGWSEQTNWIRLEELFEEKGE